MPNLVGTGLNQVPTNSMLGGLAYQDPEHASIKDLDLKNLSQINSEITGTAVDIFIYDTSKDSDGGAWRKRTQHTSWYNETLGTSTRGTRREFPAVAVIVCTSTTVRIYDGDDPDLPMWMEFVTGGNWSHILVSTAGYIKAAEMLNGELVIARNLNTGWQLVKVSFISDTAYAYKNVAHGTGDGQWNGGIVSRNGYGNYTTITTASNIVSQYNNDVAMTVLPNAPIDPSTGLPVPTIAVATDEGVSIIKDDGTVVDMVSTATYNDVLGVRFIGDNKLLIRCQNSGAYSNIHQASVHKIPNDDESAAYYSNLGSYIVRYTGADVASGLSITPTSYTSSDVDIDHMEHLKTDTTNNLAFGFNDRLTLVKETNTIDTVEDNASVAFATTSYNTGWMHGDIKGAFLSDTDATNVTGTELWPEGDFADANEWSSAGAEWTISGGTATVSDANGGYSFLGSSTGTLTNGKKYVLSFTVSNYSGGRLEATQANSSNIQIPFSANGSYSQLINYTGTTGSGLGMYGYGGGAVGFTLDNLYLRELEEEDRSVNNTGLGVYGTITKSAVATGAELVAYSGWSSSNYLLQPYNSDLDFGTGDFTIMYWFNGPGRTNGYHLYHSTTSNAGPKWETSNQNTGYIRFYDSIGNGMNITGFADNVWNQIVIVRRSGVLYGYMNGEYNVTTACNGSLTNTSAELVVGNRHDSADRYSADDLALLRISKSAASAEQIKKMYEDEKVLFQENAACTLYGSSDAVTALAYDDKKELLHVGTSSGRSDFQGLRRINNTTTAVTTAISASKGFVAEQ